jgi:copper(I)-binding protein
MALLAAVTLTVTGCGAGQYSQTADQVAAINGANGTIGDLTVLNAQLTPTDGEDYPAGSSARVLLWISNDSINPDTLSGVSTTAAKSVQITGSAQLPAQTLSDFATDTGTRLVVTGFLQDQYYGVSIPMTFSFKNSGSLTLNIPIAVPGQRTGGRETVEILPAEPSSIWAVGAAHATGTSTGNASDSGNVEGQQTTSTPTSG